MCSRWRNPPSYSSIEMAAPSENSLVAWILAEALVGGGPAGQGKFEGDIFTFGLPYSAWACAVLCCAVHLHRTRARGNQGPLPGGFVLALAVLPLVGVCHCARGSHAQANEPLPLPPRRPCQTLIDPRNICTALSHLPTFGFIHTLFLPAEGSAANSSCLPCS